MLTVQVAFAAGSAYDNEHHGLSALTTALLDQGNGRFTGDEIAERLADNGAQYSSEVGRDKVVLQLKTLSEPRARQLATDTFATIINQPHFKQAEFTQEKSQQLTAITQRQESPQDVANVLFFNKLYGKHPYAHPIKGTSDTVKAITRKQVQDFYNRYFIGSEAVLVMVGAISSDEAHQLAERIIGARPKGVVGEAIPKAMPATQPDTVNLPYPSAQTMIRLGQIGIDYHSPDFFPLLVGNYTLGGGSLVSRLALEVREKRGLTYGVSSQFLPMPANGPFIISLSTKNTQAAAAMTLCETILKQFVNEGPSEEELLAAKNYLVGSFPLSLASNSNIASMLLNLSFYHLPDDYLDTYIQRIEAVRIEDIKQAFARHIQLDNFLHISVGSA